MINTAAREAEISLVPTTALFGCVPTLRSFPANRLRQILPRDLTKLETEWIDTEWYGDDVEEVETRRDLLLLRLMSDPEFSELKVICQGRTHIEDFQHPVDEAWEFTEVYRSWHVFTRKKTANQFE